MLTHAVPVTLTLETTTGSDLRQESGSGRADDRREGEMAKKDSIIVEFRSFVLRGNVVDLAVAIAVGAAFTAVVASLTAAFITPLIGAIFGSKKSFDSLSFSINHSKFAYGLFINALISFLITAAVLFFLVVKPIGHLLARLGMTPAAPPTMAPCPSCLTEIPVAATRCAACTTELDPAWAPVVEDA
jgi:large conductance mechanosensitive channel